MIFSCDDNIDSNIQLEFIRTNVPGLSESQISLDAGRLTISSYRRVEICDGWNFIEDNIDLESIEFNALALFSYANIKNHHNIQAGSRLSFLRCCIDHIDCIHATTDIFINDSYICDTCIESDALLTLKNCNLDRCKVKASVMVLHGDTKMNDTPCTVDTVYITTTQPSELSNIYNIMGDHRALDAMLHISRSTPKDYSRIIDTYELRDYFKTFDPVQQFGLSHINGLNSIVHTINYSSAIGFRSPAVPHDSDAIECAHGWTAKFV